MSKRDDAKRLFLHYMEQALEGAMKDADRYAVMDMRTELRDFVDNVIDAAKEELRQKTT